MITINVPAALKRKKSVNRHQTPPMGWHKATLESAVEGSDGVTLVWALRAEHKLWRQNQVVGIPELTDIFVDLGLAGRKATLTDAVGRPARINIATAGGRKSSTVIDVGPAL